MAIQVTGSFQTGLAYYKDPIIELIPHLLYRGGLQMEANVCAPTTNPQKTTIYYTQVATIPYYPVVSELDYPTTKIDPYSDIICALETYVINDLSGSNPDCTFNIF